MRRNIKRFLRYSIIYGPSRAIVKSLGRLRFLFKFSLFLRLNPFRIGAGSVGIVGAGQHAYSSIAFFLTAYTKAKLSFVLDVNPNASSSLALAYGAIDVGSDYFPDKLGIKVPDIVYVASNHATHADYSMQFLEYGVNIFVEKPLAMNFEELWRLSHKIKNSTSLVYAGYNRPHSKAVRRIISNVKNLDPISLSCSIIGHFLPDNHWYRDGKEGTRVVSNMGHWIDLAVHFLFARGKFPSFVDVTYTASDKLRPSDNVSISLVTSEKDLITIFFTSRSEPYEGVNETILFQQGSFIAKIDDFRSMSVWNNDLYKKYYYWPKDNGHKDCVLQPYSRSVIRTWEELELSTSLMLSIDQLVLAGTGFERLIFK